MAIATLIMHCPWRENIVGNSGKVAGPLGGEGPSGDLGGVDGTEGPGCSRKCPQDSKMNK